jgi:hypothetical protein
MAGDRATPVIIRVKRKLRISQASIPDQNLIAALERHRCEYRLKEGTFQLLSELYSENPRSFESEARLSCAYAEGYDEGMKAGWYQCVQAFSAALAETREQAYAAIDSLFFKHPDLDQNMAGVIRALNDLVASVLGVREPTLPEVRHGG